MRNRLILLVLASPLSAWAQAPQAVHAPASSAVSLGGMLQMLAGLLLVLAVIAAAAWMLKRFAANPGARAGAVRIIAGAAVGQRERVVIVEIGATWLVLGVAPGQVRALYRMPKAAAGEFQAAAGAPASSSFPAWLRQFAQRRDAS